MKFTKVQEARWKAATELFKRLLHVARKERALIMFDGMIIHEENIIMKENSITVRIGNASYMIFEKDTAMDHGLYDTVQDFKKQMEERFKVVSLLKWS